MMVSECQYCKGIGKVMTPDIYGYAWETRCPKCQDLSENEKRWRVEWGNAADVSKVEK